MRDDRERTYMALDHTTQKAFDYVEEQTEGQGVALPEVAHALYGQGEDAYRAAQQSLNTLMVKDLIAPASMQSVNTETHEEWAPYFEYRDEQGWSEDLVPFYQPRD